MNEPAGWRASGPPPNLRLSILCVAGGGGGRDVKKVVFEVSAVETEP